MPTFQIKDTVGEIVTKHPGLSRVFEKFGIDYCCGGKKSLEDACKKKGVDPRELTTNLEQANMDVAGGDVVNAADMTLAELADHIEAAHHDYLRAELPRLNFMTKKVAAVHGDADVRLREIHECFVKMATELDFHMMKEEQILFPMIRSLESSAATPAFHCGTLNNPIHQMEHDHEDTGEALARLRSLSDDFTPPDWACNTYRAMLHGLEQLERDLHAHMHKENNILFPRASAMESQKRSK